MSESTEDAPKEETQVREGLTFTLNIVSPTPLGLSSPLSFPKLLASTTIKQLKALIRDALPSKPADESQRLIHRGRMLSRETETMLDIFGEAALGNSESQTLHLVLRPSGADAPSNPITRVETTQIAGPQPIGPNGVRNGQFPLRPQSVPANPIHSLLAQQAIPQAAFYQHPMQHAQQHGVDQLQHDMTQRLHGLQREAHRLQSEVAMLEQRAQAFGYQIPPYGPQTAIGQDPPAPLPLPQNLGRPGVQAFPASSIASGHRLHQPGQPPALHDIARLQANMNLQREQQRRAYEGRHGVQDNGSASGRASPSPHRPDHTTTQTRESIGPNGERWRVTVTEETTIQTMPTQHVEQIVRLQQSQHPHSHHHQNNHQPGQTRDVQDLLRNADRLAATQMAQNMMARSLSNPPTNLGGASASAPATAGPGTPAATVETPASSFFVPAQNPILTHPGTAAFAVPPAAMRMMDAQASREPTVYILTSPEGPRALLMTNAETFFTPRQSSRRLHPAPVVPGQPGNPVGLPEFRNRGAQRARRGRVNHEQHNAPEPLGAPHANPPAGAFVARLGPLLWLVVRLVGFVWFFTSGNSSWTRWLMVSGLAFIVFIFNTGIFNGVAEQVWGPVRRHLEALIPLNPAPADPAQPAPPARHGNGAPRRRGEPDPAIAAARILEQHRRNREANEGWLRGQVRRIEHAFLLFVASLVPGVGERHIQAREAEANAAEAERQRLANETAAEAALNAEGEGGVDNGAERNVDGNGEGVAIPAQGGVLPMMEV